MRKLFLLLAFLFWANTAEAQYTSIIVDEGFTNASVTCTSTGAGAWSDSGIWSCSRIPISSDWVQINHAVTISGDRNAWTVYVASGGSLTCNGAGSLTFSNTAYESGTQFYTGMLVLGGFTCVRPSKTSWARTTAGIASGATQITVDACSGWVMGDRILLPDTRERDTREPVITDQFQPEVMTISSIASCVITFTGATTHAYTTARDHAGTVERTIPVANLTRDFVFKSASAVGTRGHILFDKGATVDAQYMAVQDLGRTLNSEINGTTNHIGRYAFHLHHTAANATFTGNVVERSKRWAYTVHDSSDNTITYNIAYDALGWGIGTETGSESGNLFDHNFVTLVAGDGSYNNGACQTANCRGNNGSGYWFESSTNVVTYNFAADCENTGFSVWDQGQTNDLATFSYNESVANQEGFTWWGAGNDGDIADHLIEWHSGEHGFYGYGVQSTFTDYYSRGDPSRIGSRTTKTNWFGDYDVSVATWLRADVQNKDYGWYMPYGVAAPQIGDLTTVRQVHFIDSYMWNEVDFLIFAAGLSTPASAPTLFTSTNVTHGNTSGIHYSKLFHGDGQIAQLHRMVVVNYNGTSEGFEVYSTNQTGASSIPVSATPGPTDYGGCPVSGQTNTTCWAMYSRAIYGAVSPVTAHSRANVTGLIEDAEAEEPSTEARPRLRKRE